MISHAGAKQRVGSEMSVDRGGVGIQIEQRAKPGQDRPGDLRQRRGQCDIEAVLTVRAPDDNPAHALPDRDGA